jgi:hypothetical protein
VKTGVWAESVSIGPFVGAGYVHDAAEERGKKSIHFLFRVPEAGKYEVRLAYTANPNRATNVPVTIAHAGGEAKFAVNQKKAPPIDGLFLPLGKFEFEAGKEYSVTLSNTGVDGHVIADAVWVTK